MPALAPELNPLELEPCVDVDVGAGGVEAVLLDEADALLVGAAEDDEEEEEEEEETALPSCCVTVPSDVTKNPLPAAQQPPLFGTLSAHQLPSGHAVNGTSVPLSATRSSVSYASLV